MYTHHYLPECPAAPSPSPLLRPPKPAREGPRAVRKRAELLCAEFQILSRVSLGGTAVRFSASARAPAPAPPHAGLWLRHRFEMSCRRRHSRPASASGSRYPEPEGPGCAHRDCPQLSPTPARASSPPPPHGWAAWVPRAQIAPRSRPMPAQTHLAAPETPRSCPGGVLGAGRTQAGAPRGSSAQGSLPQPARGCH